MANPTAYSRMQQKYTDLSGVTPTINTATTIDNSWLETDISHAEMFVNVYDDKVFTRTNNGIYEFALAPSTASTLSTKTVEIGDWDMDGTAQVLVNHGLSSTEWKNIRTIYAMVRDDVDTKYYPLDTTTTSGTTEGGIGLISPTQIGLARTTSGTFDSINFDKIAYNRGWVTITYIPD